VASFSSSPLVSMEALHDLEEALDGQPVLCRGFVGRYVEMWPQRNKRIRDAVAARDWDEATEATLSLYSSSAMVGAAKLGQVAESLVVLLKEGRYGNVAETLADLEECGNLTTRELTTSYVRPAVRNPRPRRMPEVRP